MIYSSPAARSPFDELAPTYDTSFEENPVTQATRPVIQESLVKYFKRGDHILEVNCGTGTDALFLSRHGIRVTATDQSPAMIERAVQKSTLETAAGLVDFAVMGFDDLPRLKAGEFDGGFSNFGGLNCASDIRRVSEGLAHTLRPGAPFIACILNRLCLWEIMSFAARGRFIEAVRRLRSGRTLVNLGNGTVAVSYYSPRSFARAIEQWFEAEECYGVNILSPGSNSSRFIRRFPRLTRILLRLDASVRRHPPFTFLGDHFVMVARKREA